MFFRGFLFFLIMFCMECRRYSHFEAFSMGCKGPAPVLSGSEGERLSSLLFVDLLACLLISGLTLPAVPANPSPFPRDPDYRPASDPHPPLPPPSPSLSTNVAGFTTSCRRFLPSDVLDIGPLSSSAPAPGLPLVRLIVRDEAWPGPLPHPPPGATPGGRPECGVCLVVAFVGLRMVEGEVFEGDFTHAFSPAPDMSGRARCLREPLRPPGRAPAIGERPGQRRGGQARRGTCQECESSPEVLTQERKSGARLSSVMDAKLAFADLLLGPAPSPSTPHPRCCMPDTPFGHDTGLK